MRVIDAEATKRALPFDALIAALRDMFANGCVVPQRHVHELGAAEGRDGDAIAVTSLLMPAWLDGRAYGVKIVNVAPGNAALGLPAVHASYLLHDATTGVPLALIDGDQITMRRTVAASALAASYLARSDASRLLVVGAGRLASVLPEAYREVRELDDVAVWARRPAEAEALAARWRSTGLPARAVGALGTAVSEADIVSCATLATEPLIEGRWLRDGTHLDLIGSFTPAMREADDACFAGAAVYVDTEEALLKSGDLLGPVSRDVLAKGDVRGTLAMLCSGQTRARRDGVERTVFKSVGSALEDLAAAMLVADRGGAMPPRA